MPESTPADEPQIPSIEDITARIEAIADVQDPAVLDQLTADIRAAYEAERNGETVDTGVLTDLTAGLSKVTERRADLAASLAEAQAELDRLDAIMAGDAVELSAEDAAAFDGWTDDELAAVAGWGADEFAALTASVSDVPPEDPDPEVPEAVEPPAEAPAAAAPAAPRTVIVNPNRMPASPAQPQPAETEGAVATLARTGQDATEEDVWREMHRTAQTYGRRQANVEIPVASIRLASSAPRLAEGEDAEAFFNRQLDTLREYRGNQAHTPNTRQASGTLCAPPFVDYAVPVIGSDAQPIGGLFPRGAGGTADQMKTLRFFQALTFDDFTDVDTDTTWGTDAGGATAATVGTGSATATQNALAVDNASSPYPKTALRANCPDYVDCEQRAVWLEIVYDNLGSMAWPEFVAAVRRGGDIALAQLMDEQKLEDWYQAAETSGSTLTSIDQGVNANHNYLRSIVNIVQTDRSNKRDWDTPYVVAQPAWADSLLAVEQLGTAAIAAGQRAITEARAQIARDYNISFTNYLSRFGTTSAAYLTEYGYDTKLPALPADGDTPEMPCQARVGIARDDAAFNRVGDTLNLGVLRTEADLENNDWRTFYETWSRLCFRIPPIVADVNVNPNMLVMGYEHNPQGTSLDYCAGTGS
jgi:hypothetical protein